MTSPPQQQPPPQQPPPTTTTTTTNPNRDNFLRHLTHLNKLSHKITKPTSSHHTTTPPPPPPPPQQPPQPPVYNISKSDFRDVVQKLTGSPSHSTTAATATATKPNSSRLQRIRPPPLTSARSAFGPGLNPMSPLPPLPTCHSSAESPISAYMRFLNANDGFMFPPPENFENLPPPPLPFSGGGGGDSFGCLPSPKLILPLSPTVSSPK